MSEQRHPVLVYDRIAWNRLTTWLLLAGLPLALLPILLGLAQGLRLPVINKAFWLYAGPTPSRRALILEDILWGQGGVAGKLRILALDILWGQGGDARLHILEVIIAASILVCVMYLVYRHAGAALALRVARARRVGRGEERLLARTVENLCIGAGLPRPRLYVIETAAANALATGWDPDHASIVVTRGLLARLDRRELEAVLAHELSHIGNYDTRLATLAAILSWGLRLPLVLLVEPVRLLFRIGWWAGILAVLALLSEAGITPLGLIGHPGGSYRNGIHVSDVVVLLVYFVVGLLIQRAIARQREYLADAEAFLLTRAPGPLARALAKLAAPGGPPMRVNGAFSHLYVSDPLVGNATWWDRVLSTHPPLRARLARLAEMGGTHGPSPVTAPESDPLANVPEARADRVAPGDVRVGDAPDRTLIGLTVAGAVGGVGLLAASLPAAPLFQLLGELSFSAFLQVVVFTTALYVARKLSIEILVAILAGVAMFYHPLARGFVDISPGFALFPAGLLLLSRRWPGFWRDEAAAPKEAAREVTARESGAAHAVSRSIPPSPGARAGATPVTPRTGASTDAGGAHSREDPREATHQTREPGGGGRSPAA